jgi:UDP-N-acetylmuramoylalanine--D-glutamate ligase
VNRRVASLALLSGSGTDRLLGHDIGVEHRVFDDLPEAVEWAAARTEPGGTVLLSPGFASFGMFRNEFDRGNRFRDLVKSRMERDGRHRS